MTTTASKPVKFGIRLLNHPIYQDPDGFHTYFITRDEREREVLHVPLCPLIKGVIERVWECAYQQARDARLEHCQRCLPHGSHHITLPDGTKRNAPMGPLFTGNDDDRYRRAEYALVEKKQGQWRVRAWAESAHAAIKLAVELGVPYILGPRYDSLSLPTPIRPEDL
jgi:hypothetical protein